MPVLLISPPPAVSIPSTIPIRSQTRTSAPSALSISNGNANVTPVSRITLELSDVSSPSPSLSPRPELTLPILNDWHEPIAIKLWPSRVRGDHDGERRLVKVGSQQFAGIDWLKPGEYSVEISLGDDDPLRPRPIIRPLLHELILTRRPAPIEDSSAITISLLVWNGQELLLRDLAISDP